ncbi:MAG TPA: hypothetical protein VJ553_01425 [Candidatus Paceibacterota bacterium]|nr:hypothetical protein [Candidatus Paceibacterota bacterium]
MSLRIILFLLILLVPVGAFAQVTEEEFWANHNFLYQFTFTQQGESPIVGRYELTTGDEPRGVGSWSVIILGPRDQSVAHQYFDLSGTATNVPVRYQPNGTAAQVIDPQGALILTIDLQGSRVCDEDNVCESQYGEMSSNCPVDCGSYAAVQQTASIAAGGSIGKRIGAALMGLALAATGILIIRGVSLLLDRRHGA